MHRNTTLINDESKLYWETNIDNRNNYIICKLGHGYPIEQVIIKKSVNENKDILFRITIEIHQELFLNDDRPGSFAYEFLNSFYSKVSNTVQRGTVFECNWFTSTYDAKNINTEIACAILSAIHDQVPFLEPRKNDIFNFLRSSKATYEPVRLFAQSVTPDLNAAKEPEHDATQNSVSMTSKPGLSQADHS